MIIRTPSWTFRPRITAAALRRSSIRPLVHDPTTTWSIGTFPTFDSGLVFSGRCGNATTGSSADRSTEISSAYRASGSAVTTSYFRFALPSAYALVAASNGKIPFFAPASIGKVDMVKRHAIDRCADPSPAKGVEGKDVILHIIGEIGVD